MELYFRWLCMHIGKQSISFVQSRPKGFLQKQDWHLILKDYYAANVAYKNTSVAKSQNKGRFIQSCLQQLSIK